MLPLQRGRWNLAISYGWKPYDIWQRSRHYGGRPIANRGVRYDCSIVTTFNFSETTTSCNPSQNPSSILATFLIRNTKKEICGLLVTHWWRRGGAGTFGRCLRSLCPRCSPPVDDREKFWLVLFGGLCASLTSFHTGVERCQHANPGWPPNKAETGRQRYSASPPKTHSATNLDAIVAWRTCCFALWARLDKPLWGACSSCFLVPTLRIRKVLYETEGEHS